MPNQFKISKDGFMTLPNNPWSGYISSRSYYDRNIALYGNPIADYYSIWNIVPCEEYDIIDIEFDYIPGQDGYTISSGESIVGNVVNPSTWETAAITYSMGTTTTRTVKYTQSESYKKSVSVSKTSQSGFSWKIPLISNQSGPIGEIGGSRNYTINTTATEEWSKQTAFEESTSDTESRTISATFNVPPGGRGNIYFDLVEINLNLTYIATLRGKTTGKVIKTTGVWSGYIRTEANARGVDTRTGEEYQLLSLEETEPPVLAPMNFCWPVYTAVDETHKEMKWKLDHPAASDLYINVEYTLTCGELRGSTYSYDVIIERGQIFSDPQIITHKEIRDGNTYVVVNSEFKTQSTPASDSFYRYVKLNNRPI